MSNILLDPPNYPLLYSRITSMKDCEGVWGVLVFWGGLSSEVSTNLEFESSEPSPQTNPASL